MYAIRSYYGIAAYQDIQAWNMLAAVYSSQTINGAEGIYLDEILGRRGVFRKDASAGTGYATVISDGNRNNFV